MCTVHDSPEPGWLDKDVTSQRRMLNSIHFEACPSSLASSERKARSPHFWITIAISTYLRDACLSRSWIRMAVQVRISCDRLRHSNPGRFRFMTDIALRVWAAAGYRLLALLLKKVYVHGSTCKVSAATREEEMISTSPKKVCVIRVSCVLSYFRSTDLSYGVWAFN